MMRDKSSSVHVVVEVTVVGGASSGVEILIHNSNGCICGLNITDLADCVLV